MTQYPTLTIFDSQSFWLLQGLGWSLYAGASFICGPVWYGFQDYLWDPVVILIQALSGLLISLPLARIFMASIAWQLSTRVVIAALVVILASILWTLVRLNTYHALMPSGHLMDIWREFGGWLYVSFIVFMCWSGLYYGSVYFKLNEAELANSHRATLETQAAKTREQELLATTKDAQLRMLRYQLNPHFLYNTLNAINALVQLDSGEKAQNMIQQLSTFLRHSLDDDSIDRVQFRREIENTMLFLAIEKARFEDALKIEIDVADGANEAMLPGLILQPLIENAIKYAIAESELGGTIRISAAVVGERLHITVSDSGPDIRPNQPTDRKGIGLRNVRERLTSHYDENFTLKMENDVSGGLTVVIDIPYEITLEAST